MVLPLDGAGAGSTGRFVGRREGLGVGAGVGAGGLGPSPSEELPPPLPQAESVKAAATLVMIAKKFFFTLISNL